MVRPNQTVSRTVLWTLLFFLVTTSIGIADTPQAGSTDPIAFVPADSMFCIKINNLSNSMVKLDQFLAGVMPESMTVSSLLSAQFTDLLGSIEPKGINLSGKYAVFGPLPGTGINDSDPIGILIPISSFEQFTHGNPNVTPPDAQGIVVIGEGGEIASSIAIDLPGFVLMTSPEQRQRLVQIKKSLTGPAFISLNKQIKPEELEHARNSPLWAYANIQMMSQTFGPMMQAQLQEAKKALENMPADQAAAAIDMNADMMNTLMKEFQSLSLTLNPTVTALRTGFTLTAVPNTVTARLFQGTLGTSNAKFLPYLENGAIANAVISLDPAVLSDLNNLYFDIFSQLAEQTGLNKDFTELKQLSIDATNNLTGTAMVSFSADAKNKPPFKLQYIAGIKDPLVFYRLLEQSSSWLESGPMADTMKESGISIKFEINRNVETYKNIPVDAIKIVLNPTKLPPEQRRQVTGIIGEGIEFRLAVVDNFVIYSISGDSASDVHTLIDRVKGDIVQPIPSEIIEAMQLLPGAENANFFATYNFLRLGKMITDILSATTDMPPISISSQSNIAVIGKMANGSLSLETAVPKQHLVELMNIIPQLEEMFDSSDYPPDFPPEYMDDPEFMDRPPEWFKEDLPDFMQGPPE